MNHLGNTVTTWCFQTLTHKEFDYFGDLFLENNKKVLNDKVYEIITPRVLSRWFMDDGGINGNHSKGIQFNTQGFSIVEICQLCEAININYDFDA